VAPKNKGVQVCFGEYRRGFDRKRSCDFDTGSINIGFVDLVFSMVEFNGESFSSALTNIVLLVAVSFQHSVTNDIDVHDSITGQRNNYRHS